VSTLTLGADIIVIIIIIIISGYGINWNEIYYYFLALFCHVLSPILVAFSELNTFCDFEIVKFDEGRCTPELCCAVLWLSQSVNQPVNSAFCKPSRSVLPGMSNP